MSRHQIDYESLAQDAMRGLVRTVMQRIAKSGLPGDHHFYISFHTRGHGAGVSKRLLERYPDEMTIVLQNKYSDLKALDDRFEVTLWFDSIAERLTIPYAAIKVFFDPSVPFGHQFEGAEAPGAPAAQGPVLIDTDGRGAPERRTEIRSVDGRTGPVTSVSSSPNPRSRQGTQSPAPGAAAAKDPAKRDNPKTVVQPAALSPLKSVPAPAAKAEGEKFADDKSNAQRAPADTSPSAAKPTVPGAKDAARPKADHTDQVGEEAKPAAKVVALDAFRKKN